MINGLVYQDDFLSIEEGKLILSEIDHAKWDTNLKRRVQHYGYIYDYKKKNIDQNLKIGKLPDWLVLLEQKIKTDFNLENSFDQVIINEYQPGQGISSHIDCIPCFEDIIISISLLSQCIMQFSKDQEKYELLLNPRSILLLKGEARYNWKHGIKAVKNDKWLDTIIPRERRLSITFRKIKIKN
ncbi:alpha-ketoglutarate-dependent dioxygenase AlkB [Chryseobacterium cheonjiense]|uniref:Alpha-ketoglutarate-dependent dioxygenase AlkB n=1 Tax=Chryseobacterium cheonjiense TaxID=2728845 RepID=A0A7Y0FIS9_9FLAO|nr:alpha-ketoglutarate-dependent dioxygenase AlkB [Chryseobacterium cheonjiense]NML57701.1 alpha-ketoglutarate-dependent dioxygenase AlkB [Chryseobacterium cheonjiense]